VTAEALWPDHRGGRAAANLRSALWQARRVGTVTVIDCAGQQISLSPTVDVDVWTVTRHAHQIVASQSPAELNGYAEVVEALARKLLPDWPDEWLVLEREGWDQLRLHALETLARRHITAETYLPALEVALTAVAIEPVRESDHRTVIEIRIVEGNSACAIKHYQRYRSLLQRELGVLPSQRMIAWSVPWVPGKSRWPAVIALRPVSCPHCQPRTRSALL
jgi:DNA-binding SARP family transcriptional activator